MCTVGQLLPKQKNWKARWWSVEASILSLCSPRILTLLPEFFWLGYPSGPKRLLRLSQFDGGCNWHFVRSLLAFDSPWTWSGFRWGQLSLETTLPKSFDGFLFLFRSSTCVFIQSSRPFLQTRSRTPFQWEHLSKSWVPGPLWNRWLCGLISSVPK